MVVTKSSSCMWPHTLTSMKALIFDTVMVWTTENVTGSIKVLSLQHMQSLCHRKHYNVNELSLSSVWSLLHTMNSNLFSYICIVWLSHSPCVHCSCNPLHCLLNQSSPHSFPLIYPCHWQWITGVFEMPYYAASCTHLLKYTDCQHYRSISVQNLKSLQMLYS